MKVFFFFFFFIGLISSGRTLQIAPDIQRILDKKRLVVAMHHEDYFPFFAMKGGKLIGYDVDLSHHIARKLGVDLVIDREGTSFDDVIERVVTGKADLAISYLSVTLKRASRIRYSNPYLSLRNGLLYNRVLMARKKIELDHILQLVNEPSLRFISEIGSSFAEFTGEEFPKSKLVLEKNRPLIFQGLIEGKADVLYNEEYAIKEFFRLHPEQAIYIGHTFSDHKKDYIAIAASLEAPHLLSWINAFLMLRNEQVTYDDLYKKYSALY